MFLNYLRKIYKALRKNYLLLKLAIFHRPIIIDQGWIKLELGNPKDEQIIRYVLNGRYWHKCDEDLFRDLVNPGDVAIDIGANVGFVTIELAHLVGLNGKVVAIEPSGSTYAQLLRTLELNGPVSVEPINLACGSSAGKANLYSIGQSSGLRTMKQACTCVTHNPEPVALDTLDSIVARLKLEKVDFIKIDVEGYESEVLKGAKKMLSEFRPKVYFEVSNAYHDQSHEACTLLRSMGYVIDLTQEELKTIQAERNVLAIPSEIEASTGNSQVHSQEHQQKQNRTESSDFIFWKKTY